MRRRPLIAAAIALVLFAVAAACDPPPPTDQFPNATTTGADESQIVDVVDHDITVTAPDTTIQNTRFINGASVFAAAANLHLVNDVFEGGRVDNNVNGTVHNGMAVINTTFENTRDPATGQIKAHNDTPDHVFYRVGTGGYAASGVRIVMQQEGFRVGGKSLGGTDVAIQDSYVLIDTFGDARWNGTSWVPDEGTNHVNVSDPNSPNNAPCDGHPDGVQGFDGPTASIVHNTFDELRGGPGTCNNAPIFITDGSNGGDVFNNAALGGGFSIRLHTGSYRFKGNRIQNNGWGFGPLTCNDTPPPTITLDEDNQIAELDASYHVASIVRQVTC